MSSTSIVVLLCGFALILIVPLESGRILKRYEHFTVREFDGAIDFEKKIKGASYKFAEILPTNMTAPEDDGRGTFGDMSFIVHKDGYLISRDSVFNDFYNTTVEIVYYREIEPRYTNASGINIFNYGRDRGFTYYAAMGYTSGWWETKILVAPRKQVRISIELYAKRCECRYWCH